jgi:hypothetical protein
MIYFSSYTSLTKQFLPQSNYNNRLACPQFFIYLLVICLRKYCNWIIFIVTIWPFISKSILHCPCALFSVLQQITLKLTSQSIHRLHLNKYHLQFSWYIEKNIKTIKFWEIFNKFLHYCVHARMNPDSLWEKWLNSTSSNFKMTLPSKLGNSKLCLH